MTANRVAKWPHETLRDIADALRLLRGRGWLLAAAVGLGTAILIGVPTDIVANDWFVRMTPIRPQDYVIWATTALLAGLVAGTFTLRGAKRQGEACAVSGGLLSFLAVGCAVCNKLVILLLGTSGALTFFAPLQIYLGLLSLAALVWTLRLRARAVVRSQSDDPTAAWTSARTWHDGRVIEENGLSEPTDRDGSAPDALTERPQMHSESER